ncbi:MAG: molybdate ABC transporter substrate-binding protein, partial [Gammaproteobacteria bacterium]|nr:molybdate ABC transporter substrate-binding protein [Gammaproteobacteria bacterium]
STGKLYAQIIHGAPFDILLAADAERPKRLERSGKTVPGSRFTYATGKLVLWGPTLNSDNSATQLLQSSQIRSIAMANPLTAPYGSATRHSLQKMDLWNSLQDRLVRGENIGQSYQYVVSGAAQIGFVAYSQVLRRKHDTGYLWQVPASHHPPIRQQAVLLKRAENNPAALTFLDYLRSPQVQRRISEQGYDIE